MTETINLVTEVKPINTDSALDLLLEALHGWAFKPAGEERDRELGNRIWAITCALHPTQPSEKIIAWAKEGIRAEHGEDTVIREVRA